MPPSLSKPLFPLGRIVATSGALVELNRSRCACERRGRRLPEHERDLTGGTDPLSRGERRLQAREGPGHFWRAARAQIDYL